MQSNTGRLISLFNHLREALAQSQPSAWADTSPTDAARILARAIETLQNDRTITNTTELRVLFAPTGALQEIAEDNGWGECYVALAHEFDALMARRR